jgi:thiamine biosynthesis protein ThiS
MKTMHVIVNGEAKSLEPGMTVITLLAKLRILRNTVAIEINGEFLEPGEIDGKEIFHGDRVELVRFVGGG